MTGDQRTGSNLVVVWQKSVDWKVCGCPDSVNTLEKQHKQLTIMFEKIVLKAKTETELIADCHGGTEVNLVTALGFYTK